MLIRFNNIYMLNSLKWENSIPMDIIKLINWGVQFT